MPALAELGKLGSGAVWWCWCGRGGVGVSELGGWCGAVVGGFGVWRSGWLVWSMWCWCERVGWCWCERVGWCWCERVSWFRDEVVNFFYNGDMRNLKTVMTGEAVDKSVDNLWITFLCLCVKYTITLINTRCLYKLLDGL